MPVGATINGVTVVDDSTRVPLHTDAGIRVSQPAGGSDADRTTSTVTLALMNAFDRNYRVHGSGVDAPGRSAFASVSVSY